MTPMGHTVQRKVYAITFDGGEYEGMEVKARSAGFGQYRRIAELATITMSRPPSREDLQRLADLLASFADVLVSWNLQEEDGAAIPATLAGLEGLEPQYALTIVLGWMEAVAGVAAPLEQPSDGGDTSVEASLPMEVLSASPTN